MFLPSAVANNLIGRYKRYGHEKEPIKKRNRGAFHSVSSTKQQDDKSQEIDQKRKIISNYIKYEKLRYYTNILSIFPILPEKIMRLIEKAKLILQNSDPIYSQDIENICEILKSEYENRLLNCKNNKKYKYTTAKPSKSTLKIFSKLDSKREDVIEHSAITYADLVHYPKVLQNIVSPITPTTNMYSLRKSVIKTIINKESDYIAKPQIADELQPKRDEGIQHNVTNDSISEKDSEYIDYKSMLNLTSETPAPKKKVTLKLPALRLKKIRNIKSLKNEYEHFGKWTLYSNESDM
jgi:hypothetical protein